jgi:hypothetical protein
MFQHTSGYNNITTISTKGNSYTIQIRSNAQRRKACKGFATRRRSNGGEVLTALWRISFVVTSSSVADTPFPSIVCHPLCLTGVGKDGVGDNGIGRRISIKAAAASAALPGVIGDVMSGVETISVTTGSSIFISVVKNLNPSAPEENGEGAISG